MRPKSEEQIPSFSKRIVVEDIELVERVTMLVSLEDGPDLLTEVASKNWKLVSSSFKRGESKQWMNQWTIERIK
jgi:hypothetical protein